MRERQFTREHLKIIKAEEKGERKNLPLLPKDTSALPPCHFCCLISRWGNVANSRWPRAHTKKRTSKSEPVSSSGRFRTVEPYYPAHHAACGSPCSAYSTCWFQPTVLHAVHGACLSPRMESAHTAYRMRAQSGSCCTWHRYQTSPAHDLVPVWIRPTNWSPMPEPTCKSSLAWRQDAGCTPDQPCVLH